jgi:hypothetical protein
MESLKTATEMMTPGCFMATTDIKDAYYSVPVVIVIKSTYNAMVLGTNTRLGLMV